MKRCAGILALVWLQWACTGHSTSSSSSSSSSSSGSSSSSSGDMGLYPGITVAAPVWHRDMDSAYAMLADDTHAFLSMSSNSGQLLRVNLDGTGETVLLGTTVTDMAQDGPDLFVVVTDNNSNNALRRVPKDGSTPQDLGALTNYPYGLTVTPSSVIIAEGFTGQHLTSFPRTGGASSVRFEDLNATMVPGHLLAHGEDVIFSSGKDVLFLPAGQATATKLMTVDEDMVEGMFVDGSTLWVASGQYMEPGVHYYYASGVLYSVPLAGGTATHVLALNSGFQPPIVTPNHVFFFNYGYLNAGRLVSINRDGTAFTNLGWDKGVHDVTLSGSRLVWASAFSETPYPTGTALHVMNVNP